VRSIASAAKVDPALIYHYFPNKEHLLVEAIRTRAPQRAREDIARQAGGQARGEFIVRSFLELWGEEEGKSPFLGLMRSATSNPRAAALLRSFIEQEIVPFIRDRLQRNAADTRAGLVASQLLGLATLRYILRVEPIASASVDDVAKMVGPTISRYLEGAIAPTPAAHGGRA
jgi:AcrR family transcriptional regulator